MVDWNTYRELFPHLQTQTYLNHAAISPMNIRARKAIEEFLEMRSTGNIEFWPAARDSKEQFVSQIARLINGEAAGIALVPNTSAGLNVLARGLNWQSGDRILLNDFEFPANVIPFLNLERNGVIIDFVHHRNGRIELEDLHAAITPRTRLLSISFVQFMNGFRSDLEAIGRLCRRHGIIFCVDAIQGLGALQMNVQEWGIDFLATSGHKWLMWPAGLGFVYISPRIFHEVYPAVAGWLSLETPWDFFNYRQPFAETATRFEPGTFNTAGVIAASASLEMMLEVGPAAIQEKILQNTDYLITRLQETGYSLFTDPSPEHRSGIVSFKHNRAEEVYENLKKKAITVSLREGHIRVAPHFYNNREDLDKFLNALQSGGKDKE
ncbi:MAG: aminotransferase class V-fold PLP-dependent enzyme [Calditrichia bacterium]